MTHNKWFPLDEEEDHVDHVRFINRIMLISVVALFVAIFIVFAFQIYGRCTLWWRPARLHTNLGLLNMVGTAPQLHNQQPPKAGLDPSAIATLPIFVSKKSGCADGFECAVCLSVFEEGEMARLLPSCKHVFHAKCIDLWLHSNLTCPVCRTQVEPKAREKDQESMAVAIEASRQASEVPGPEMVALEGTSGVEEQSTKEEVMGNSQRSSFQSLISRERLERRQQFPDQANGAEDLERR